MGLSKSQSNRQTVIDMESQTQFEGNFDTIDDDEERFCSCQFLDAVPFFGAFVAHSFSESNPFIPYVGDCKALENFLATKDGWGWMFPKYLNALFRGVGQVVFANNPMTGLIILLSIFWASPIVGLATLLAASTAILTAMIFRQEVSTINSGLTTYNAVLIGSVTASLWPIMFAQELDFRVWSFIILGSALSVFVNAALVNLLGSFKAPLPTLTFAFNIVALLLFTCLMPSPLGPNPNNTTTVNDTVGGVAMELVQSLPEPAVNNTLLNLNSLNRNTRAAAEKSAILSPDTNIERVPLENGNELHWGRIMLGIMLSMGQVYGINNLVSSVLMYVATLFYSPTIFMMSVIGATLGSIFGIIFAEAPYDTIYEGIWGFNGILSACAIGGIFFVLTCHSFGTALANVIFTVLIQHALAIAFGPIKLPFFTLPFVLSSFIFLQMTATGDNLSRVINITYPESHRSEYLEVQMLNRPATTTTRDTTDEIAEEKELVLKEVKVIVEDTPKDKDEKKEETEEK